MAGFNCDRPLLNLILSKFAVERFSQTVDLCRLRQYERDDGPSAKMREQRGQSGDNMSAKRVEFQSMTLDQLWSIHEEISAILSARIKAEKFELEKRLAILNRGKDVVSQSNPQPINGKQRRKYPRVVPKYRNPQTSETWSGRGKRPCWLVTAMKSGREIEEFRIAEGEGSKARHRA